MMSTSLDRAALARSTWTSIAVPARPVSSDIAGLTDESRAVRSESMGIAQRIDRGTTCSVRHASQGPVNPIEHILPFNARGYGEPDPALTTISMAAAFQRSLVGVGLLRVTAVPAAAAGAASV